MRASRDTNEDTQGDAHGEGDLLLRWLEAVPAGSVTGGRARPVDAFADVVATAVADRRRLRPVLRRFGRRLAVEGWSLPEVGAAVERLAQLEPAFAGELALFGAGIAVAEGWADGARVPGGDAACRDPLTGLLTSAVLRIRVEQIFDEYAAAGIDPGPLYRLVVVDTKAPLELSPFVRDASLVVVAQQLRTTFAAGETVCATGGGRMVVLAREDGGLAARTNAMVAELCRTPLLTRMPLRARVVALPADRGGLAAFLADLLD